MVDKKDSTVYLYISAQQNSLFLSHN